MFIECLVCVPAREESETKKQIQFLQDAVYVDQKKGRYWLAWE